VSDDSFISRWSRRKIQARSEAGRVAPAADLAPAQARTQSPTPTPVEPFPATPPLEPLPPVESLTPESDFTPFMKPDVDKDVKRQALKTLFQDPRFNVMDGLDVYIDDYSKPDPLPEGWLEKMNAMKYLGAFVEPAEGDEKLAPAEPEPPPKAVAEQALGAPEAVDPVDTAGVANPPPDVGKTGGNRN
jgi:hypothetical protein